MKARPIKASDIMKDSEFEITLEVDIRLDPRYWIGLWLIQLGCRVWRAALKHHIAPQDPDLPASSPADQ
jgi:hypothetical protein